MINPDAPTLMMQGLVYLGAAVIAVPLSKRIGLGAVLGYLIAGILIGPWGMGLIHDVETVLHFAEFGVVMMLFLIGLELAPEKLWELRYPIFGLGGLQVLATILLVLFMGLILHLDWRLALVAGMGVAMSSTAIAVQTLSERGLLKQASGHHAFAVLLFQDLAVIPLLLGLALLAPQSPSVPFNWIAALQGLALVVSIVVGGNYLLRPVLQYIANTGMREIFIAFSLFLIIGVAFLMQSVGLSMALGAFLAGVLLADSEYRQELELDIEPFKGLLLGLFFIAVGMSVDIGYIVAHPVLVMALAVGFVGFKIGLFYALARLFQLGRSDAAIFALTLSQIGEFAFVLFATANQLSVLSHENLNLLNAVVAISMLTTPLLMVLYRKWMRHQYNASKAAKFDTIETERPVIVAGFGRFGQVVVRLLNGIGMPPTVIEYDPNQIELVRRFGQKAYYGDITRPDVLQAAGVANAKLLVIAIDNPAAALETAKYVKQHYPQVKIIARARNRTDTYEYMDLKIDCIRETFHSALAMSEQVLVALGYGAFHAHRTMWQFRQHDEKMLAISHPDRNDEQKLITNNARGRQDLIDLLQHETLATEAKSKDGGFEVT